MLSKRYTILMIDPPWDHAKGGKRKARPHQGRSLPYETMSTEAIFDLLDATVLREAEWSHCVFIWAIEKRLTECERYMELRGYKRHCRFVWDKTNGISPAFTVRYTHEYLIWYYKNGFLPIALHQRGVFKTVFKERSREHSRKPDFAYAMIDQLYPTGHRIDVFSREKRKGWDQFGNEINFYTK